MFVSIDYFQIFQQNSPVSYALFIFQEKQQILTSEVIFVGASEISVKDLTSAIEQFFTVTTYLTEVESSNAISKQKFT